MLKKGDLFLAVVLLVIIGTGYYVLGSLKNPENGITAVIMQNNKVIRRIDLKKVDYSEIITLKGKYINVIEVEPGRIRFKDADCPDRTCVSTGWISKQGETAVCLPNRAMIVIEGDNDNNKTDGVAY